MFALRTAILSLGMFIAAAAAYLGDIAYDGAVTAAAWITRTLDAATLRVQEARAMRSAS